MGWVGVNGGVVGGRVQALGTKGVPVQVGYTPPLANVLIAPVNLALFRRVGRIVVEGGVNCLPLQCASNVPILRQRVLDNVTGSAL